MQGEDSNNNHEGAAGIPAVDLRRVTSSEDNAFILEELLRDKCEHLHISEDVDENCENDFVVREGDDLYYLGNLIGKSTRLKSLGLWHMPVNNSFRDGLAVNKSIQDLTIYDDLGEGGFQSLAPFFRNTITLERLFIDGFSISTASIKRFAFLLSQCQVKSLKGIWFTEMELNDKGYDDIARALGMQPQLEGLFLQSLAHREEEDDDSFLGHIALGDTMKHWKSPCLKVLNLESSHFDDDGMIALVEGMANCSNLERLNLVGNDITEVGLRALSSLFQSKDFLQSIDMSCMNILDDGMTVLAPGLASLKSLKMLDLSHNNIGDVGLEALATARPDFLHLEELKLSDNTGFSAVGLKALSNVLQTASRLKYLHLSRNSIDDEGLRAFATTVKDLSTIYLLDLSSNRIRVGARSFAAVNMNSLRYLRLDGNSIGDNDEAMEALAEGMESLCNLKRLSLSRVSSSGLENLSPAFQHEGSCLQYLDLVGTRLEDSMAIALANGLRGNQTLTKVCFDRRSVTDVGWNAFERLLCDTSSVNNTYCSNHTLEIIGARCGIIAPLSVNKLLALNKQGNEGVNVPICKILMSHSDFEMTPLLQWKLKLLPFVVTWFEKARSSHPTEARDGLECRKLSAVYQFVSGASHSAVERYAYRIKRPITDSSSRKRKFTQCDEELG